MLLQVRHTRQAGPFSYIVKYEAEVEVTPDDPLVVVHVISTVPDDAELTLVTQAVDAIRRGAERVLHSLGTGAIMHLRGLVIHPVDISPQKFEQHTAEELLQALETNA